MQKSKIRLDKVQMQSMKLVGEDGLYTNLAYLLSGQCEMATYLALFQGTKQIVLRERKAYSGSILKQIKVIYHFLNLINKTKAFFEGLYRNDRRDYLEVALKEALLNSYIHRDYSVEMNNLPIFNSNSIYSNTRYVGKAFYVYLKIKRHE